VTQRPGDDPGHESECHARRTSSVLHAHRQDERRRELQVAEAFAEVDAEVDPARNGLNGT
jgi:hypothetical protein